MLTNRFYGPQAVLQIRQSYSSDATTTTTVLRPFVRDYPGEPVPEETLTHPTHHPDHHPIFISFFHLPCSIASSLFKLRAWQSFYTTSVYVLFGQPLDLEPSTSYSIHFFTQPVSSFRNTCPYHRDLICCSINIISSIPSISLNSLLETLSFTLTLHIHLTIVISARWSATSFSFLTGQVSLPCSILLRPQLLYNLPLLISDICLMVGNGTNCLNSSDANII